MVFNNGDDDNEMLLAEIASTHCCVAGGVTIAMVPYTLAEAHNQFHAPHMTPCSTHPLDAFIDPPDDGIPFETKVCGDAVVISANHVRQVSMCIVDKGARAVVVIRFLCGSTAVCVVDVAVVADPQEKVPVHAGRRVAAH